ncbi:ATP-binding protein [Streptomyces sp. NPDC020801]|uniref:ATP-binding protein n=1 Tax=Streptomyces sp. NPDC020801 TaxID=3365093 RepID=UPI0037B5FA54
MPEQWTPPSKRNSLGVDFAGLGIPKGRYVIPMEGDYRDHAEDTGQGYERLMQHFRGEIPLTDLPDSDIQYLREFFGQQVSEQRERSLTYFASRVPRRYAKVTPDDTAAAWARAVATNPDDTRSLLIVGPTGTGKTHYAYSVLRALAETGAGAIWTATTAADLYAQLRPRAGRDSEAEFDKFAQAGVLFVDDLGAAKLTEWTEEVTYRLINHRYEQCRPGIFTSNVPPSQLRDVLGERIASRLTEMCERVALKGDDRRKGMAA